ncbi:trigger factor [Murimonas intestini]|uniref:peptidylprolyl isomerase n=1 Tax=Murimonas intestini TaxID=1337051 RepID=A0AB73T404_9FIRM|nr:trigger factor [Murimonas intestini]MCR1840937.1 trigger factor [Murimonas intestini]MCR1865944.1 trigger factor [Murimonas intestini]MCR1883364.1 trigger factor [Murimonas intestini]
MKKKIVAAILLSTALLATGCAANNAETSKTTEKAAETADKSETEKTDTKATEAAETENKDTEKGSTEEAAAPGSEDGTEGSTESPADKAEVDLTKEEPAYKALDYVTLGEYKGLTVYYDPVEVTQDEIDSAIQSDISQNDKMEEIQDGTVENGDVTNIDYEGSVDGEVFDGGSDKGYDLTIGSGAFIPGFEDGVVGMKSGETKDVKVTFPETYSLNPDLAGKEAVFKVTVNTIKRTPELTDALVTEISEYSTVDEYKKALEDTLKQQKESQLDSQKLNDAFFQVYQASTINEYPEDVIAYRVAKMNATYEEVAKQAEMTLDEYLQANAGMNLDEFNSQLTLTLRNSLVSELILKAIAESEEMTVSEDEYQKALEEIAANANVTTDDVIERYGRTTIETNVLTNKAIQFLQDNTTFVEGKPEESTEAATEAQTEAKGTEDTTEAETPAESETAGEEQGPTETEEETTAGGEGPGMTEAGSEAETPAETEAQ